MHNHHVYVYFRFKSWVAGQTGKYMREFFMAEFAEQELNAQQTKQNCECHRCIKEKDLRGSLGFSLASSKIIFCPICGNKRCPKASDHRLECTSSNEPGQAGSVYT